MRFKKGTKVEVLDKRELPSGSWRCAQIISGNGNTYHIKYDSFHLDVESTIEKVKRKAIRPRPPTTMEGLKCWVPGAIVEVYNNHSWKLGEVSRILDRDYFFVRVLGSSMEFRVHSSCIRLRLSWQDNKWIVIRKNSGKFCNGEIDMLPNEEKLIRRKPKPCLEENNCSKDSHMMVENNYPISQILLKYSKKRPHNCPLIVESCTGAGKKIRRIYKEGIIDQVVAETSPNLCKKVDAIVSPQKMLGEKYMHASLNNRTGFSEPQKGEGMKNFDINGYFKENPDSDKMSVSSSVGSCSANNSPYRSLHYTVNSVTQYLDSCSSVAEISFLGREISLPAKGLPIEDIHQLELHAYRSTLMVLYASGPISWDQEALLSNLRCMLHISNDEHLMEVRNLVSAEKDVSFR